MAAAAVSGPVDVGKMVFLGSWTVPRVNDFVCDSAGNTYVLTGTSVVKLDKSGRTVWTRGTAGSGLQQLSGATRLNIDAANRIWVCDTGNNRFQVWGIDGSYLGYPAAMRGVVAGPRLFEVRAAVDGTDTHLFVWDSVNSLRRFDLSGELTTALSSEEPTISATWTSNIPANWPSPGNFTPSDSTFDANGNLAFMATYYGTGGPDARVVRTSDGQVIQSWNPPGLYHERLAIDYDGRLLTTQRGLPYPVQCNRVDLTPSGPVIMASFGRGAVYGEVYEDSLGGNVAAVGSWRNDARAVAGGSNTAMRLWAFQADTTPYSTQLTTSRLSVPKGKSGFTEMAVWPYRVSSDLDAIRKRATFEFPVLPAGVNARAYVAGEETTTVTMMPGLKASIVFEASNAAVEGVYRVPVLLKYGRYNSIQFVDLRIGTARVNGSESVRVVTPAPGTASELRGPTAHGLRHFKLVRSGSTLTSDAPEVYSGIATLTVDGAAGSRTATAPVEGHEGRPGEFTVKVPAALFQGDEQSVQATFNGLVADGVRITGPFSHGFTVLRLPSTSMQLDRTTIEDEASLGVKADLLAVPGMDLGAQMGLTTNWVGSMQFSRPMEGEGPLRLGVEDVCGSKVTGGFSAGFSLPVPGMELSGGPKSHVALMKKYSSREYEFTDQAAMYQQATDTFGRELAEIDPLAYLVVPPPRVSEEDAMREWGTAESGARSSVLDGTLRDAGVTADVGLALKGLEGSSAKLKGKTGGTSNIEVVVRQGVEYDRAAEQLQRVVTIESASKDDFGQSLGFDVDYLSAASAAWMIDAVDWRKEQKRASVSFIWTSPYAGGQDWREVALERESWSPGHLEFQTSDLAGSEFVTYQLDGRDALRLRSVPVVAALLDCQPGSKSVADAGSFDAAALAGQIRQVIALADEYGINIQVSRRATNTKQVEAAKMGLSIELPKVPVTFGRSVRFGNVAGGVDDEMRGVSVDGFVYQMDTAVAPLAPGFTPVGELVRGLAEATMGVTEFLSRMVGAESWEIQLPKGGSVSGLVALGSAGAPVEAPVATLTAGAGTLSDPTTVTVMAWEHPTEASGEARWMGGRLLSPIVRVDARGAVFSADATLSIECDPAAATVNGARLSRYDVGSQRWEPCTWSSISTNRATARIPGEGDYAVFVDDEPPGIQIVRPGAEVASTSPVIEVRLDDAGATADSIGVLVSIDGKAISSTREASGTVAIAVAEGLTEEAHTLRVRATDAAGNVSSVDSSFTVDVTRPEAPGHISCDESEGTAVFSWSASSPEVSAYVLERHRDATGSWVPVASVTQTSAVDPSGIPGVTYHYRVVAVDRAGNVSDPSDSVLVVYGRDQVRPLPVTDVAGLPRTNAAQLSWAPSLSEDGGLVRVLRAVGTPPTGEMDGALVYEGPDRGRLRDISLENGVEYHYLILAEDRSGLTADPSAGAMASVTPRDVDPPVSRLNGLPESWSNRSVDLTLSVDDVGDGVEKSFVTVNGSTSIFEGTITVADEGTHTVEYWSVDRAGNEETKSVASVRIDKTAPTVLLPSVTLVGNGSVTPTCIDSLSGVANVEYRVDGAAWESGVTCDVRGAGSHTVEVRATDAAGNSAYTSATVVVTPRITRIGGADRYVVASSVARQGWDPLRDGTWPGVDHVVLACGENGKEADPLSAAGLAGLYDAPILLTKTASLPVSTRNVIAQLAARRAAEGRKLTVHMIGGTASIPDARWKEIRSIPGVDQVPDRLAGRDRYAVSAAVAERIIEEVGIDGLDGTILVCAERPEAFYDALAVSPVAYGQRMPLLGVRVNEVPGPVVSVVDAVRAAGKPVYASSGKTWISDKVVGSTGSSRLASSSNRYTAAVSIANTSTALGWTSSAECGLTAKLPDSLTGGSFMGRRGGVLLFTDSTATLRAETKTYVGGSAPRPGTAWVFGGTASVTGPSMTQFEAALR